MALVSAMPVNAVARLVGEHDTRLWRVIHHYVNAPERAPISRPSREWRSTRPPPGAATTISRSLSILIAPASSSRPGRTPRPSRRLPMTSAHGGDPDAVAEVCIDMNPAFMKGTADSLANAAITFDKFHAVKIINDAVDQVRRTERKDHKLLAGTRYLWLRNPDRLSDYNGLPSKAYPCVISRLRVPTKYDWPPGTLRAIIHRVRSSLPPAMVFLGDPHSAAADHRRRPRRQTSLGRHSTLVPQQDRQRSHRGKSIASSRLPRPRLAAIAPFETSQPWSISSPES